MEQIIGVSTTMISRFVRRAMRGERLFSEVHGAGMAYWHDQRRYLIGGSAATQPFQAVVSVGPAEFKEDRPLLRLEIDPSLAFLQAWVWRQENWTPAPVALRGLGLCSYHALTSSNTDELSRLIGALGGPAAARIASAAIGIVGVGGLGSTLAVHLAQAGAQHMTLVDPDRIELTNLHRMPMGLERFVGLNKAQAVAALLEGSTQARTIDQAIEDPKTRLALRDLDLLIVTTDNVPSRRIAARHANDYLIPALGVGTGVGLVEGDAMGIEIGLALPGQGCLTCLMALPETGSFEFGTGRRGSLGSLNSIAAGLAMRAIEELAQGSISQSAVWRYSYRQGLRVIEPPRRTSCDCQNRAGIGDFGIGQAGRSGL